MGETAERLYLHIKDAELFNQKYGHTNIEVVCVGAPFVEYVRSDIVLSQILKLQEDVSTLKEALDIVVNEPNKAKIDRLTPAEAAKVPEVAALIDAADKFANVVRRMSYRVDHNGTTTLIGADAMIPVSNAIVAYTSALRALTEAKP